MSRAVQGAVEIGAAAGFFAAAAFIPGAQFLVANQLLDEIVIGIGVAGIAEEAGAIASALTQNRGMDITTRQPASFRQIIYGTQRVGGIIIYRSTTGSHHDQYNFVIVLATHEIDSIEALYLDGRRVYWDTTSIGHQTRNGVGFGGSANSTTYSGPNGQHYNFGGLVYCEARYGDQVDGDVIAGLTANDPAWAASGGASPWVGGCAYVYLKVEYDPSMFPSEPEIKFTIHGKNDIYDPRTGTTGFTSNWALCVADVITDPTWGLGDNTVNQDQLIAAANVCDEQVTLANGQTESRLACHWHYDTSTSPGDVLSTLMTGNEGRISRVGGEWLIFPPYWPGVSFTFDESAIFGEINWSPKRSVSELINRVTGTYVAPNYPYNVAGNLYDSNGWYMGSMQDNFPFAFQPTNYPEYACDELHGYGTGVDVYLTEDGGIQHPKELIQPTCLSVSQAQRTAKICLLRNRQQGTGTLIMPLSAWQMEPGDVFQLTFDALSWANKYLQVTDMALRTGQTQNAAGESVPYLYVQATVQETDPSVYDWAVSEELTVYDVPAAPGAVPYIVDPVTSLAIQDDNTTVQLQSDGTSIPRLLVTFVPPLDTYVNNGGKIEVQYQFATINTAENNGNPVPQPSNFLSPTQQPDGSWVSAWMDAGSVSGEATSMYVSGITPAQYQNINVQARAVRVNGAASVWTEVSHTLASTLPQQVTGVSAVESPYKTNTGMKCLVAVDFTPATNDPNYSSVNIYLTGYQGNNNPVRIASAYTSPAQFLTDITNETVVVTVVAVNQNNVEAPFSAAPYTTVILNGVVSAPPAPSIAVAQTALDGNRGWQFTFNIIGGMEYDLIQAYRIYHSESNVTPVPPNNYYRTIPQPQTNIGQEVVQEVTGDILFYWVSAVNTQGLESELVAVPFTYIDPGAPPPSVGSVTTTAKYSPTLSLNGWAADAHVQYCETQDATNGTTFSTCNLASAPYNNPANAYDGNQASAASFAATHANGGYAGCVWSFSNITLPAGVTINTASLSVVSSVLRTAGIDGEASVWYSADGGNTWVSLYVWNAHNTGIGERAMQTDSASLPTTIDPANLLVMANAHAHDDIAHNIFDISLSVESAGNPGPQQVSGLTAALVAGNVQLTWSGLAPLSRTDILGYEVYRALHGAGYQNSHLQTTITPAPPQATYTWSDPEGHDGSWDYWVIGHNSTGYSPASEVAHLASATSVLYVSGDTIEALKPAQAGADVTALNGNIQLQNPNFAAGNVGWIPQQNWSIEANGTYTNPFNSGYIGVFSPPNSFTSAITNAQKFSVSPGSVVSASCNVWGAAGATTTNGLCIRANFYDYSGNLLLETNGSLVTTSNAGWLPSRVVSTAPANSAWCQIDVAAYAAAGVWCVANFQAHLQPSSLDEVPDGGTYLRMPGSNMDGNRRGLIDFSSDHINKTLDYVGDGSGRFAAIDVSSDNTNNHIAVLAATFPQNTISFSAATTVTIGNFQVTVVDPTDIFWLHLVVGYPFQGSVLDVYLVADGGTTNYLIGNTSAPGTFMAAVTGLSAGVHNLEVQVYVNAASYYTPNSNFVLLQQVASASAGFNTAVQGNSLARPASTL